jgi:formate C-acetyltransferase
VDQAILPHDRIGGSILGMWPVDSAPKTYDEHFNDALDLINKIIADIKSGTIKSATEGKARFALMARDHYDADILFRDMQKIIAEIQKRYADNPWIESHEIAYLLENLFVYDYGEETRQLMNELPWFCANHLNLDYGMIINKGYGKLLEEIESSLAAAADPGKKEFYTAAGIAVKAAIRYITRYAAAYHAAAEDENDEDRREELYKIAAVLKKTATEKADSFYEALQLMWISHILANTQMGSALSFGRFDQYMYPFYARDKAAGVLGEEEAKELLCCLMLKVIEPKMRTVQSLTLGGTTPEGKDGANELTRVFLQATRLVRLPYPNVSVRVGSSSPEWLYDEAIATVKLGFGIPMFINDDVWIKNFHELGHPIEKARDFYNMGCVEMLVSSRNFWMGAPNGNVQFARVLNRILEECAGGKLRFDTFDALFDEMKKQVSDQIRSCGGESTREAYQQHFGNIYDPFGSVMMKGPMEKGVDMYHGGLDLPYHAVLGGSGLATAADSLIVIKKMVFEQKKLGFAELVNALKTNFAGQEGLRLRLMNVTESYGNDEDEVDAITAELFRTFTHEVYKLNQASDYERYVSSYFSYTASVRDGELTGATSNGRLKGAPLSDGLGPTQGRDINGPTKLINSLLKLDYTWLNGALATNLKLTPSVFSSGNGTAALKTVIKAYLNRGGPQIQLNFVRREDLLEAQQDPQKYRNLVVRIAGFCEYFVNLDFSQQNEIIKRTEHEM